MPAARAITTLRVTSNFCSLAHPLLAPYRDRPGYDTVGVAITMATLLMGCNNDLDLFSVYKEIPVVTAILDVADSVHYVRIERAFVNPQTNALTISQDPDSLYYPDILEVTITAQNSGNKLTAERIDGAAHGLIKDPGGFATTPNILYAFSTSSALRVAPNAI